MDASTIRSNVKNYLAVLSMHETRGFFKPQDIKRVTFTGPTNAVYLPFPGTHSGQVNLDSTCKKGIGESAQMVWFLGMKFLTHFGTPFTSAPSPTYDPREVCNLYAKMQAKMPSYAKKGVMAGIAASAQGGSKVRDYLRNKSHEYTKNSAFVNEHHRRVFKRAFPATYAWVFDDMGSNATAVSAEFKSTQFHLALRDMFLSLGFQTTPTNTLLPIRGGRVEEIRILAQQHTGSLSRMGLY